MIRGEKAAKLCGTNKIVFIVPVRVSCVRSRRGQRRLSGDL
jgi:hypothetical protein